MNQLPDSVVIAMFLSSVAIVVVIVTAFYSI